MTGTPYCTRLGSGHTWDAIIHGQSVLLSDMTFGRHCLWGLERTGGREAVVGAKNSRSEVRSDDLLVSSQANDMRHLAEAAREIRRQRIENDRR
jgi:hypothetical protein